MIDERNALAAALAGRYEIDREIGRGGMATVYLARDVKHDRPVALKVLSPELGAVLGVERFLSEIKVTANLQHPNLLPLFDSGEAAGLLFYVMPYVEGESLRHRMDREKQLPVDEAVGIAVATASALDYAHRHGVIHRDLKPENILLHDGQPLVADFGIALAVSNAGGARVTQTGLSLGTPQYMSPEQATGDRTIDSRTDIYSLGAVTYEMLSGEPPHVGPTAQAIIARLMTEDPRPLSIVRRSVPAHVEAAVRRALEKLPADRFPTAKEFGDALQGRGPSVATTSAAMAHMRSRSHRLPWALAAMAAIVGIVASIAWWRASQVPPPRPMRFTVEPPAGQRISDIAPGLTLALSRDGQMIAFLAGNGSDLYVRRLDQLEAAPVPKATLVTDMHFSGDGKSMVYMGPGGIHRISISGGDSPIIADLAAWNGMTWTYSPDVVYAWASILWRVPPSGPKRKIAAGDPDKAGTWSQPFLFPDGKTIGFRAVPPHKAPLTSDDRIGVISIDGGQPTILDLEGQSVVGYLDGLLIFSRVGGRIFAVPFDVGARKVKGEPVLLLDGVSQKLAGGAMAVLSDNGTLAYLTGSVETSVQIVDAHGSVLSTVAEVKNFSNPAWSPDGKRIAVEAQASDGVDVWVYDIDSRVLSRLTQRTALAPAWSPDSRRIAYLSGVQGGTNPYSLLWMSADGSGTPQEIAASGAFEKRRPTSVNWSGDGKYIVVGTFFSAVDPPNTVANFAVPVAGGPPIPIDLGGVRTTNLRVSPDNRWVAFTSTDNGENDIYLKPFLGAGGRVQVSPNGGSDPRWDASGRRLYFREKGALKAATLDVSGAVPRVVRIDSLFTDVSRNRRYGVHPDGKRFAVIRDAGSGARLIVVTDWMREVRAKLSGK